jgi:hypothetical protein
LNRKIVSTGSVPETNLPSAQPEEISHLIRCGRRVGRARLCTASASGKQNPK